MSASEDEEPAAVIVSGGGGQLRLPPAVRRNTVVCSPANGGLPSTPLLNGGNENQSAAVEKIAELKREVPKSRTRKLTEPSSAPASPLQQRHRRVSGLPINPAYIRRKAEHRRRFMGGVPERGRMTMFDLIYYNPENGSRMQSAPEETAVAAEPRQQEEEEAVDNPEAAVEAAQQEVGQ
jgi:hypothetical protein